MSKMDTQGMSPELTPEERAAWEKSGKKQVHKPAVITPRRLFTETMVKELNLEPIAQLLSYHVAGLEPSVMGMGPVYAAPKAIEKAGLKLKDIEQFELNEAFASQSVAVLKELDLNPDIVNVNGGAIALGHPLGCTGAKLSVQLFNEMRRRKQRYGMVTMCVGTGQGAAGVYELLK